MTGFVLVVRLTISPQAATIRESPLSPGQPKLLTLMPVQSWVLTVTVLVEKDSEKAPPPAPNGWDSTDKDIQKAVTAAIVQLLIARPGITVTWESLTSTPLDGQPDCGRCAVCNRWVYDIDKRTEDTPTCICRGAVVDGRLLCDEHLPEGHPYAF